MLMPDLRKVDRALRRAILFGAFSA